MMRTNIDAPTDALGEDEGNGAHIMDEEPDRPRWPSADSASLAVGRATWSNVARLTFAFLFVVPGLGQAQMIRSYESLDLRAGDRYYASAQFLFDGAVGNSDYSDTVLSGAVGYQGDLHWVRFYPTYRLKRSSGENVVHNRAVHFRHSFICRFNRSMQQCQRVYPPACDNRVSCVAAY